MKDEVLITKMREFLKITSKGNPVSEKSENILFRGRQLMSSDVFVWHLTYYLVITYIYFPACNLRVFGYDIIVD